MISCGILAIISTLSWATKHNDKDKDDHNLIHFRREESGTGRGITFGKTRSN